MDDNDQIFFKPEDYGVAPKPEEKSAILDNPVVNLARGIGKGAVYGLPQQLAQATQFAQKELGGGENETARKIAAWGEEGLGGKDRPQPGAFEQAGEMIPLSVGVPAAATAVGSALRLIPHPIAQVAATGIQAAGLLGTPLVFGLSQAQQTRDTAAERGVDEGNAPYITGSIEWGGETLANMALARLLGPFAGVVKDVGKSTLQGIMKQTPAAFLKQFALQTAPTEVLTEMGQNYFESLTEKSYGIRPEADPWQEAKDAIAPTLIMSALLGGGGSIIHNKLADKYESVLQDPEMDPGARMKVAAGVANQIEDESLRAQWLKYADRKIRNGEAIDTRSTPIDSLSLQIDEMIDQDPVGKKAISETPVAAPQPAVPQPEAKPYWDGVTQQSLRDSALGAIDYISRNDFTNMTSHPQFADYYKNLQDLFAQARKAGAISEEEARPLAVWLMKHAPSKEADSGLAQVAGLFPVGAKIQDANGNVGTVAGHKRILSDTSPVKIQVSWDNAKPGKLPLNIDPGKVSLVKEPETAVIPPATPVEPPAPAAPAEPPPPVGAPAEPAAPVAPAAIPPVTPEEPPAPVTPPVIPPVVSEPTPEPELTPKPAPAPAPAPAPVPEPQPTLQLPAKPVHMMSRDEYIQAQVDAMDDDSRNVLMSNKDLQDYYDKIWSKEHADEIQRAIDNGETVPQEVLDSAWKEPQPTPQPPKLSARSWYDFKDLQWEELNAEERERVMLESGPTPEETAEWEFRQGKIAKEQEAKLVQEEESKRHNEEVRRRTEAGRAKGSPSMHVREVAQKIHGIRAQQPGRETGSEYGAPGKEFDPSAFSQMYADAVGVDNRYGYLAKIADKLGVKVIVTDANSAAPSAMTDGCYIPAINKIFISYRAMAQALDRGPGYGVAHGWETLVHELLHAIVRQSPHWETAKTRLIAFRQSLTPHMEFAPEEMVGLINHIDRHEIDELISEAFTNQAFAQWLDSLPAPGIKNPSKTFWGKLKDIIMKSLETFGLSKSKLTELNEIMDAVLPVPMQEETPQPEPTPEPEPTPTPEPEPEPEPPPPGTTGRLIVTVHPDGRKTIHNSAGGVRRNNWGAIVKHNPSAKGGLDRKWLPKRPDGMTLGVEDVKVGDFLELAGDKRGTRNREYYQVTGIDSDGNLLIKSVGAADIAKAAEQPQPEPAAKETIYGTPDKINTVALSELLMNHISATYGKIDKRMVMSWVADAFEMDFYDLVALEKSNLYDHKGVEEAYEYAMVRYAAAEISRTPKDMLNHLIKRFIDCYNNQPNLASRTSTSTIMQQYSTPLPLAWLMNKYLGMIGRHTDNNLAVYEPTAGNGMLMIGAKPRFATVNEFDQGPRLDHLKDFFQEFGGTVTNKDALSPVSIPGKASKDRVVANPPFGEAEEVINFAGYKLTKKDHQVIALALQSMKDNGKAAFIIGGRLDMNAMTRADQIFFNWLYNHYNVTHNISVNGDLYSRMGTSFPVRLITIDGRKVPAAPFGIADYTNIQSANTFQEISDILEGRVKGDEESGGSESEDQGKPPAERGNGGRDQESDTEGAPDDQPGGPDNGGNTLPDGPDVGEPGKGAPGKRGNKRGGNDELQPGQQPGRGENQSEPLGGSPDEMDIGPAGNVRSDKEGTGTPGVKDDYEKAVDGLIDLFMPYTPAPPGSTESFDEAKYQQVQPLLGPMVEAAITKFGYNMTVAELRDDLKAKFEAKKPGSWSKAVKYVVRFLMEKFESIKQALQSGLTFQQKYEPRSKGPAGNTVVPKNQAQSIQAALDKIEQTHGDIDQWVMKELQYDSTDSLYEAFSAEQIDALAMAIENIGNENAGLILGDQTGVGKGRVVAGMIRYANIQGKIPIFVTAKANLFTDMYRDLMAINHAVKPFIMNSHSDKIPANITNQITGALIHEADRDGLMKNKRADIKAMAQSPEQWLKSKGFKVVFSTYSQHNGAADGIKDGIVEQLAKDNIIILDESHEAAGAATFDPRKGTSNTNQRFMRFISDAKGVLYSSATFAKAPPNMILYYRTVIGDSGLSMRDLLTSIERGGVPFQEYLSQAISKMGQYVRRELDFNGISYTRTLTLDKARPGTPEHKILLEEYEDHKRIANATNIHVLAIEEFDDLLKITHRSELDRLLKEKFEAILGKLPDRFNPSVTSFTSLLHNIEQQLLSSLKVEKTLAEAKHAIDQNQKVVITFENTMESFLNDVTDKDGLHVGDEVNFNFRAVLERALNNCLKFSVEDAGGKKIVVRLTIKDLEEEIPEAADEFKKVMAEILKYNQSLHASPIDFLRSELRKYTNKPVYELTGRSMMVDYDGEGGKKRLAHRSDPNKNEIITAFNSGKSDVLILNESGSTGLSLHAAPNFKDQRQRKMIIHQADRDINTFMQIMGRINRKGQTILPEYLDVITSLPSELRPATVRERKLASLKANTTSNQEGAERSKETPDMMNVYGDRVTRDYLAQNKQLALTLGLIRHPHDNIPRTDRTSYAKVSGAIAVLPVEVQKEFFDDVESMYNALIDEVNARGENELISKDYDFQAQTMDKQMLFRGTDENNPFTGSVYVEKMQVRMLNKPHNTAKLTQLITDTLGIKLNDANGKRKEHAILWKEIDDKRHAFATDLKAKIDAAATKYLADWIAKLPEKYNDQNIIEREASRRTFQVRSEVKEIQAAINQYAIGATYRIPIDREGSGIYDAVLTNVLWNEGTGNPVMKSKVRFFFSIKDPKQVAINHPGQPWFIQNSRVISYGIPTSWDNDLPQGQHEPAPRYIVTGNMLKAFMSLPSGVRPEMVSFTRADGKREFGLLVSKKDEPQVWGHRPTDGMRNVRWNEAMAYVTQNADAGQKFVSTENNLITIQSRAVSQKPDGTYNQEYLVNVPASNKEGSKYYQDQDLMALARGQNFRKQGGRMLAVVEEASIGEFLRVLQEKHDISYRIPDDSKPMPYFPNPETDALREAGEAVGARFDGFYKVPGKDPVPAFTDLQTGSSFALAPGESVAVAVARKRAQFGEGVAPMPFTPKAKEHFEKLTDIITKNPEQIPQSGLRAFKDFEQAQGNFKAYDKYFGLPWWNAQKYPQWKKAFEIFGIKRPETRGGLMHRFASIAEPFLKLDVDLKKLGYSQQRIADAKSRIEKIIIAGDAMLGKELRDLRRQLKNMGATDPGRPQLVARIQQIETLNRYSDDELRDGIKTESGELVKLNDPEIRIYASVRSALDEMFATYTDHLQAQVFRKYKNQKWYALLCQAAGVNLQRDATAKLVGAGLNAAALTYAKRIQVDIQGIFERIEKNITGVPDKEVQSTALVYKILAGKMTKDIIRLREHVGKLTGITDDQKLTETTRAIMSAYIQTRPELKRVNALRNLYRKQVAFFPRVREQGKYKLALVEHIRDEDGNIIKDRKIHSEMFSTEAEYKALQGKFLAMYGRGGRLPTDYEITQPEAVVQTPEMAFQGVNDINMQRVLDDAIDNMKLKEGNWAEKLRTAGYQAIAGQFQSRGWGSHLKHRQRNVVKGYQENDLQRVLFNYLSGMAGIMTKQESAADFLEMMKDIKNPSMFEGLSKYGRDQLRNSTPLDKYSQRARSFMFTWYLGGLIRPAFVQLTQNFVTGIPEYAKFLRANKLGGAGKAELHYMKAMKDIAAGKLNDNKNLTGDEQTLIARMFTDGVTQDQYIQSIFENMGDKFDKNYAKALRALATPFSFMEMYNRQAAALTMFRTAFKLAQKDGLDHDVAFEKAFNQARAYVYDTHYAMSKANLPQLAQGGDATSIGLKTLYTFRSFTHNYLIWMSRNLSSGDFRTTMHTMAYMMMFGGLISLPFLKDLFEWIEKQFGYSPATQVRKTLRSTGGKTLETFGMSGLPGVLGANISGSLSIGIPGLGENPLETVYGVYGGMMTKLGRAAEAAGRGDLTRVSTNLAPEFIRNPLAAAMESPYGKHLGMTGFATTTKGRPVYGASGKPIQMTPGESMMKSVGFSPTENAREKEMNQTIKRQEEWGQEEKRSLSERYRIEKINHDPKAMQHLMAGVKKLNQQIRDREIQKIVPLVSVSTIVKNARQTMNKKQRKEMAYKQNVL